MGSDSSINKIKMSAETRHKGEYGVKKRAKEDRKYKIRFKWVIKAVKISKKCQQRRETKAKME